MTSRKKANMKESALAYAEEGFRVLPVHTLRGPICCTCSERQSCVNPGDHPWNRLGVFGATRDPARIRQFWRHWPNANIGVATGVVTSWTLIVLTLAFPDGLKSLNELRDAGRRIPKTLMQRVENGDCHYFFSLPMRMFFRNRPQFLPGLSLKAEGDYVKVPPSIGVGCKEYEWLQKREIAEAPMWLSEVIFSGTI